MHDAVKQLKTISDTLKRSAIARGAVAVVHERRDDFVDRRAAEDAAARAAHDELVSRLQPTDDTEDGDAATPSGA